VTRVERHPAASNIMRKYFEKNIISIKFNGSSEILTNI
jgi:hypothetical protein